MITEKQLNALINSDSAYLEYLGNLYFYIGKENGKYFFQDANDDTFICFKIGKILNNKNLFFIKKGCVKNALRDQPVS